MFLNNICKYAVATILISLFIAITRIISLILFPPQRILLSYIILKGYFGWLMEVAPHCEWCGWGHMDVYRVCENRWCILALWQNASYGYGCFLFILIIYFFYFFIYLFYFYFFFIDSRNGCVIFIHIFFTTFFQIWRSIQF